MRTKALVVARHRRHLIVEDEEGSRHRCLVRGRSLRPLVGDQVEVDEQRDGTLFVAGIAPRQSLFTRVDSRGRPEGVAANITQIIVVVAPQPAPDWYLVDRYLAAAELMGLDALLVWNKSDLGAQAARPGLDHRGHEGTAPDVEVASTDSDRAGPKGAAAEPAAGIPPCYEAAGYRVFATSAKRCVGLEALEAAMRGERSTLVGQSGVGKSSLINALLGDDIQEVQGLSDKGAHGRHTTTSSTLHRLPRGGELIDSPGVRHYAPFIENTARIDTAFREFRPYLGQCRFDDCRHESEPDCAVKQAVASDRIDARRYESYLRLRGTLESLR